MTLNIFQQTRTMTLNKLQQTRTSKGTFSNGFLFTRNLSRGLPKFNLNPVVSFNNAQEQKETIFKTCKDKSFVYRWVNKTNGKDYLGSTSNAKSRLSSYFDFKTLSIFNMPIYKAILKYGHSNFIFEIVEFCEPGDATQREQFYLDQFDFDYNVLENANSLFGFKHSADTLAKMKGRQNALGFNHSLETLEKLRDAQTGKKHSPEALDKMREQWANRKLDPSSSVKDNDILSNSRKKIKGTLVVTTNIETSLTTEYLSISEAAKALNVTRTTLRSYIKNNKEVILLKRIGNETVKERYLVTVKAK
jgi:group I intron endonuclease